MSNPKNRAEELLDELIKDKSPEDLLGNEGLLKQLTKSLIERAMQGEMTHHLGYEKNSSLGNNTGNSRNGKVTKAQRRFWNNRFGNTSRQKRQFRTSDHTKRSDTFYRLR
ncbi:transposase, mutator-like family protein [Leptospira mayottensis 200901122]|uniref:Transposase, mutator-like family protein n=1 Tax=Leptospira mayottensis 200901122 TaxID=1193010 RepID=A0AA87MTK9_9LEPT|nr:transposase, mutator-like family protein [Leptospira mayottensis 200901122]